MNQEERKTAIRRMRVLVAAACILMLLYGLRLIFLQLVNGDDFKSQATNTTDYKFTVTAARGDIVDSRGERIATSVTGYNVVLNKLLMGDEDLDGMLQKIVELLRANGESWNDTLLISQPDAAGNYTFTAEEGSTRDQKALAAMKDNLGLQQYATANDVMEKLVEDYDLASYPLSWQRTLGGIHYEMQLQAFSNVNNFIMAENVSEATVATIKEHSLSLPGVEIVETSTRSYEQSTVLPHVLGRVGKITAEKWKVTDENGQTTYPLREKGYTVPLNSVASAGTGLVTKSLVACGGKFTVNQAAEIIRRFHSQCGLPADLVLTWNGDGYELHGTSPLQDEGNPALAWQNYMSRAFRAVLPQATPMFYQTWSTNDELTKRLTGRGRTVSAEREAEYARYSKRKD